MAEYIRFLVENIPHSFDILSGWDLDPQVHYADSKSNQRANFFGTHTENTKKRLN